MRLEDLFESMHGFAWVPAAFTRKGPHPETISKDLTFRWSFPSFPHHLGKGVLSRGAGPAVVGPSRALGLPRCSSSLSPCSSRAWVSGGHQDWAVWHQWPICLLIYLMFNLQFSLIFSWWLFQCFGYPIFHIISTNMAI